MIPRVVLVCSRMTTLRIAKRRSDCLMGVSRSSLVPFASNDAWGGDVSGARLCRSDHRGVCNRARCDRGATQWTAAALGYQAALGSAWFTVSGFPVYLPWRLFEWWYVYNGGMSMTRMRRMCSNRRARAAVGMQGPTMPAGRCGDDKRTLCFPTKHVLIRNPSRRNVSKWLSRFTARVGGRQVQLPDPNWIMSVSVTVT